MALAATRLNPFSSTPASVMLTDWEMLRGGGSAVPSPGDAFHAGDDWIPALAPGTVASALRTAGRWSWNAPPALDDCDWWYRCRFDGADASTPASLQFDGLATLADVWLNGEHILSSDNMFVAHSVDVTGRLRASNEILVRFASLRASLRAPRPRPQWKTRLVASQNMRWIRTSLLGRMPGWSFAAPPVGPWKPITLRIDSDATVESRKLLARVDGNDGIVAVTAHVKVPAGRVATDAMVSVGDVEREAIVRPGSGCVMVHATIRIPNAQLWWPHTHGAQPLYDVALTLMVDGSPTRVPVGRVGFRTVRLEHDDGDFAFVVNGERIFCRGACWSPVDPLSIHAHDADYRRTLELARAAGMNMMRVGGTMAYESDAFHDLCDELGIMVWQDLMFANMDYPTTDPVFIASVEREVRQLLQRIGARPSLALICGNSEVEQQAAMLGLAVNRRGSTLFAETLPNLCAEIAANVPYWPSSPSGGSLPFHVNAGDGHYFGYGPYLRPFSDVRASDVRFASETLALSNIPEPEFIENLPCGAAGAGHHPDWKRGIPRDNGATWDFEDVRDHYVREIFHVDPMLERRNDPERYLALGRAAGGEMMTNTIGEWRRVNSHCAGALVWLYRDVVPGAGCGILDADGSPKAAYHYLARAFRPVNVVLCDDGLNGVSIHMLNDTADGVECNLRLALYRGPELVGHASSSVSLPPRSAQCVAAEDLLGGFADVNYAYRFGPPNHDVLVATLSVSSTSATIAEAFHFPLGLHELRHNASIAASVRRTGARTAELEVSCDATAIALAIDAAGWDMSDNHFHLAAHSERRILLTSRQEGTSLRARVTALNAHEARLISTE